LANAVFLAIDYGLVNSLLQNKIRVTGQLVAQNMSAACPYRWLFSDDASFSWHCWRDRLVNSFRVRAVELARWWSRFLSLQFAGA
jgi:hypothetical protein